MAKRNLVGLDIGTTHVRAAEVSYGNGGPAQRGTLSTYAAVPLPQGAVQDGEVVEPEAVATALRNLWNRGKFSTKDVAIGVGNQRVIVRELEVPWMPLPQLRKSLSYHAQDILPMAADDALMDFFPTAEVEGNNGPALQGLFVAAVKDTVKANLDAVSRARLNPVMVDLNAFALMRAVAHGDLHNKTVAVVDVGARITNVIISSAGTPAFVRVLPAGGQDVTDAVAGALNIPQAQAEMVKREIGVGYSVPPERQDAADATATVVRTLIESIRNTFVYYGQAHPDWPLDAVVLTGGGVFLPGFGQFLATASRLPVALGKALDNLTVSRGAGRHIEQGAEYATTLAIGLGSGEAA